MARKRALSRDVEEARSRCSERLGSKRARALSHALRQMPVVQILLTIMTCQETMPTHGNCTSLLALHTTCTGSRIPRVKSRVGKHTSTNIRKWRYPSRSHTEIIAQTRKVHIHAHTLPHAFAAHCQGVVQLVRRVDLVAVRLSLTAFASQVRRGAIYASVTGCALKV